MKHTNQYKIIQKKRKKNEQCARRDDSQNDKCK